MKKSFGTNQHLLFLEFIRQRYRRCRWKKNVGCSQGFFHVLNLMNWMLVIQSKTSYFNFKTQKHWQTVKLLKPYLWIQSKFSTRIHTRHLNLFLFWRHWVLKQIIEMSCNRNHGHNWRSTYFVQPVQSPMFPQQQQTPLVTSPEMEAKLFKSSLQIAERSKTSSISFLQNKVRIYSPFQPFNLQPFF